MSPGPGFDTVNRLGEVADDTEDDGSGLPKPGTLQHTFTLGVFRLQQALNQLVSSPDSFLADGISLFSGQPAADNKIGQAAGTSPLSYSSITSLSPTNVALGVLATGKIDPTKNKRHCFNSVQMNIFTKKSYKFCIQVQVYK